MLSRRNTKNSWCACRTAACISRVCSLRSLMLSNCQLFNSRSILKAERTWNGGSLRSLQSTSVTQKLEKVLMILSIFAENWNSSVLWKLIKRPTYPLLCSTRLLVAEVVLHHEAPLVPLQCSSSCILLRDLEQREPMPLQELLRFLARLLKVYWKLLWRNNGSLFRLVENSVNSVSFGKDFRAKGCIMI